jgi:hypothetical protein
MTPPQDLISPSQLAHVADIADLGAGERDETAFTTRTLPMLGCAVR